MSYDFTKKRVTETPFLFMKRRVKAAEIGAALGEILPAVYGYATQKGIAFAGPPVCRYHDMSAEGVLMEAGMPVQAAREVEGGLQMGSLPGGEVVSTIHRGPYDTLREAHVAIEAWLKENQLQPSGGPWEVYLTDPGQVPDPADWETEVVWPI